MRLIPAGFDPDALARIDTGVASIRTEHGVALPLVVESGSRAWGFPSPDSDYDVRFLFVRPALHYVSPWPVRDVIETPIVGDLDINGWDVGKALRLLANGNAVILEWLTSPVVYAGDPSFRDDFLSLVADVADRDRIARHYLHLGEGQMRRSFADELSVEQKRIFYALHPAAALRWLRQRPEATVAPMHFPTLLAECDPPEDVVGIVSELLVRKAQTHELGRAPFPPAVRAFVEAEFERARATFTSVSTPVAQQRRRDLDAFLRETILRLGPAA